jgi:hypothetical protein
MRAGDMHRPLSGTGDVVAIWSGRLFVSRSERRIWKMLIRRGVADTGVRNRNAVRASGLNSGRIRKIDGNLF